jgi:hypothetical protein
VRVIVCVCVCLSECVIDRVQWRLARKMPTATIGRSQCVPVYVCVYARTNTLITGERCAARRHTGVADGCRRGETAGWHRRERGHVEAGACTPV